MIPRKKQSWTQPVLAPVSTSTTPVLRFLPDLSHRKKGEYLVHHISAIWDSDHRILIPKLDIFIWWDKTLMFKSRLTCLAILRDESIKGRETRPCYDPPILTILQSIMTMAWNKSTSIPIRLISSLEISKIVTPEVEVFSNEEIAEILKMAQLEPIHIHAVIATAIYTGARRGEIAGLKWEDVDFEKRTMYIRRSCRQACPAGTTWKSSFQNHQQYSSNGNPPGALRHPTGTEKGARP